MDPERAALIVEALFWGFGAHRPYAFTLLGQPVTLAPAEREPEPPVLPRPIPGLAVAP